MPHREIVALVLSLALLASPVVLLLASPRRLRPHLPPQRFRLAPWSGFVVFAAFAILFLTHALLASEDWISPLRGLEGTWRHLVASTWFIELELLLVGWILLPVLPYPSPLSMRRTLTNSAFGIIAWSCFSPVVYSINKGMQVLVQSCGFLIHEHPLITMLRLNPNDFERWLLVVLAVVAVAPLREELFFRGILQPWVIRRPWGGDFMIALAAIAGYLHIGDVQLSLAIQPVGYVAVVAIGLGVFERFWSRQTQPLPEWWSHLFPRLARGLPFTGTQLRRGIVGTSLLFAMFHSESWPDPVALTFLGIGLGWLAWRTQSLTAPVVCHALFNALSLAQLRFGVAVSG